MEHKYEVKSKAYELYQRIYYINYNAKFTEEEKQLMIKFSSFFFHEGSKQIFFNSIYRMQRFYPKFLIRYLIAYEYKQYFKANNASEKLIDLIPFFTNKMFLVVISAYHYYQSYEDTIDYFTTWDK